MIGPSAPPLDTTDLILIIAAIALSALCSGLEIAFVSANKLYIELERKRGALWARLLGLLQKQPARVIGALLVGNNIALVVYGLLMAEAMEPWLERLGMGPALVMVAQTVLSTMLILVVAEFLPKALFRIDANRSLALFAFPLVLLYLVLWPPMMLFTGLSELLLRLFRIRSRPGQIAFGRIDLDDFLREMAGGDAREQKLDAEVEYFRNTLELSSIKAREIMVPRARMEAIDAEDGVEELHRRFVETGMSKLLVFKSGIDNVIFIPGTMPADEVLQLFIKQRSHVAVVVDEFGGTAGMLTMEDVVETIVGDIEDEHDAPEDVEEQVDEHQYLLSGRLEAARIRERFHLELPDGDYDTLAGFILHHTGDLPEQGQSIDLPPFRFTIAQVSHGRIDLVRLEVTDPEAGYAH